MGCQLKNPDLVVRYLSQGCWSEMSNTQGNTDYSHDFLLPIKICCEVLIAEDSTLSCHKTVTADPDVSFQLTTIYSHQEGSM